MTTNQHTPGPWYVTGSDVGGAMIVTNDAIVARWPENGPLRGQVPNARLIAAAPDLLAALEHLLADARACEMDVGQYSGSLIEARAAIAKATGA